tara:strand:+ start:915 stop:1073 length:159 start_codon:yes stop_codon:yes gene_type:complete
MNQRITLRVSEESLKQIEKIIEKDGGERYDNASHFFRCAILKLIRDENGTKT